MLAYFGGVVVILFVMIGGALLQVLSLWLVYRLWPVSWGWWWALMLIGVIFGILQAWWKTRGE